MNNKTIMGFALLLLLSGCMADEYKNDPISSSLDLQAGVAVPIATAKADVHKLVSKITNKVEFSTDAQGESQVTVFQEEDSVKYFGLNDLYSIPPASVTIPVPFGTLSSAPLTVNDSVQLVLSNGSLSEVKSKIRYSISADKFPFPVALTITLKDVSTAQQKPVTIKRDLPIGTTLYLDSLIDADLLLKNNKFAIQISLARKNASDFSNNIGSLTISTTISNLTYIKGTLRQTALTIPEQFYNINMGIFRQSSDGSIVYDNPRMSITSTNSSPFGAVITPYLLGVNTTKDDSILLTTSSFPLNKRISTSSPSRDTIVYNKTNSNIKSFLGISPDHLKYKGSMVVNPSNQISSEVIMQGKEGVYLGYRLDFPLHITVDSLIVTDTIQFGGSDLFSKIENATLVLQSRNGFPFEARSILKLCDDQYTTLDTLHLQLLKGAAVDANGFAIDASNNLPYTEYKNLSATRLEKFKKTTNFVLITVFYTTGYKKNKVVIIQEKNSLTMQIGLRSQINTSL